MYIYTLKFYSTIIPVIINLDASIFKYQKIYIVVYMLLKTGLYFTRIDFVLAARDQSLGLTI